MKEASPTIIKNGSNCYLAQNPKFTRHNLPLSTQFHLLHKEFLNIERATVSVKQYNFSTSQKQDMALNRYFNIMAIEETLFPPIPGSDMEKAFYKKLKAPRGRIPKEVVESRGDDFYALLDKDKSKEHSSTASIFKRTTHVLAGMGLSTTAALTASGQAPMEAGTRSKSNRLRYINGNLIDLATTPLFVASQAPMTAGFSDFFATLYEHRIQLVIMLTKTVEDGVEKADQYWPTGNEAALFGNNAAPNTEAPDKACNSLSFGEMTVSVDPEQPYYADNALQLVYRPLRIQPCRGGAIMPLLQIQYTGWPDLGVPSSAVALCELLKVVDVYQGTAPVLVHCSAGVGRTGTFIGTYAALQAIRNGCFKDDTLQQTVMSMRCARYWMVQRIEQYLFMYQILLTLLNLDMSKFAAKLQRSAAEYQQKVAEMVLRNRQLRAEARTDTGKAHSSPNSKQGGNK